jgi:ABC-type amino acid transport substrate-binding protein
MKTKRITACAVILAMTVCLASCGGGNADVPGTAEEGILKVGIVNGNDRFARDESGVPVGMEADIARITAENGGYALQLSVLDSEQALFSGIMNGEYDLCFGRIADTDQRIASLTASSSYGKGGLFLVTPKYNYMDCLTELQNGTIGYTAQAAGLLDEVDGIQTAVTSAYADLKLIGGDISSGTILAALVSEREAVSLVSNTVQAQELINSPKENYVALMPQGSPLKEEVNKAISQYRMQKTEEGNE